MACRPNLLNIRKACDIAGNANGVRGIVSLAYVGDVASIPAPTADTYNVDTDIVMLADAGGVGIPGVFYEWEFSEIGSNYNFEQEGEDEDGYGTHILTMFLQRMTSAKNLVLDEAKGGKEFVVVFTDRNEVPWLIGNERFGATLTATPGTDVNGRNGYNVVIRFRSARNLYRYNGVLNVAADV